MSDPLIKIAHQEKSPKSNETLHNLSHAHGSSVISQRELAPDCAELLTIPWASHTFSLLLGCGNDRAT